MKKCGVYGCTKPFKHKGLCEVFHVDKLRKRKQCQSVLQQNISLQSVVNVLWNIKGGKNQYFIGVVDKFCPMRGYFVKYLDGDNKWQKLDFMTYSVLPGKASDYKNTEVSKNEFWKGLASDLKCSICLETLENPITTKDCMHSFCFECLKTWVVLHKNKRCPYPYCNTSLTSMRATCENQFIRNAVAAYKEQTNDHQNVSNTNAVSKDANHCSDLDNLVNAALQAKREIEYRTYTCRYCGGIKAYKAQRCKMPCGT